MGSKENIININIGEIVDKSNMSISQFSTQYHIPRRTLEDWLNGKRTPPSYVMELLDFKVISDLHR